MYLVVSIISNFLVEYVFFLLATWALPAHQASFGDAEILAYWFDEMEGSAEAGEAGPLYNRLKGKHVFTRKIHILIGNAI